MRLINTTTLILHNFPNTHPPLPRYAVLSHTWDDPERDEVTFQEFTQLSQPLSPNDPVTKKKGFAKIQQTCRLARKSDIKWAWVDTCCIDKSSSAELTEAINSMFRWYAGAAVCYAYLADLEPEGGQGGPSQGGKGGGSEKGEEGKGVKKGEEGKGVKNGDGKIGSGVTGEDHGEHDSLAQRVAKFAHCRWFTRGWTLQELIAPRRLGFYNRKWEFQGEKTELSAILAEITNIRADVLHDAGLLPTVPVAQRMSWAASRQTSRVEDMAYCLLGIFDVNMPLLYGEGTKAFVRLQEEIIKESNDLTLFAWRIDTGHASQRHWGILAPSPSAFADCNDIEPWVDPMHNNECVMTSKGLRVTPLPGGGLRLGDDGTYVMNLQCHRRDRVENLGIFLQQHGCDVYTRVWPDKLSKAHRSDRDKYRMFYVAKAVPPVRSVVLTTSHRRAIDFSRALKMLETIGIRPANQTDAFDPEGHWDAQRSWFLTRGMRNFTCRVQLSGETKSKWDSMVMKCHLGEDGLSLSLDGLMDQREHNLDTLDPGPNDAPKQAILVRWKPNQWFAFKISQEFVQGQPVYFILFEKA